MKVIEAIRNILCVIAIVIILGFLGCLIFHLKPAAVMSGLMEPAFHTGSVVFINEKETTFNVGDPIAFEVGDAFVTHRITQKVEGGYKTKGDANEKEDPWTVAEGNVKGKVVFTIPLLGYIFVYATSKRGLIIFAALILCLILSSFIVSNSGDDDEDDEDEANNDESNDITQLEGKHLKKD